MLNAIHAAEVQYRHDTERLDRELLLLARIAERTTAPTPTSRHRFSAPWLPARRTTNAVPSGAARVAVRRVAWPRPISEHGHLATPAMSGAAVACC